MKKKNRQEKRILLVALTHGNESIGLEVVKQLDEYNRYFDWVIANPLAYKKGLRFIDCDLNRYAPGNLKSDKYEKRRVAELILIAKKYKYIIDIHSSISKQCGIFVIITKPTMENLILASNFNIKNIVIWLSRKKKRTGPWTKFVRSSIEIESGNKDNPIVATKLKELILKFIEKYKKGKISDSLVNNLKGKNIYYVFGAVESDKSYFFKDFKLTNFKGEKFYPILSDQYDKLRCYKMKKITNIKKIIEGNDKRTQLKIDYLN